MPNARPVATRLIRSSLGSALGNAAPRLKVRIRTRFPGMERDGSQLNPNLNTVKDLVLKDSKQILLPRRLVPFA